MGGPIAHLAYFREEFVHRRAWFTDAQFAPLLQAWRRLAAQRRGQADPQLAELRWLLEELRVSMFAQELRTPMPVSVKRLQKALDALRA